MDGQSRLTPEMEQKIDAFFKAPNGTTFYDADSNQIILFAIKIPIENSERFSVVATDCLYQGNPEKGFLPDRDLRLELDSFVDNKTGTRILFGSSCEFRFRFDYTKGISFSDAVDEICEAVLNKTYSMSNQELHDLCLANGDNIENALNLSERAKENFHNACVDKFLGLDKDSSLCNSISYATQNELKSVITDIINTTGHSQALFAVSYLKNKESLIQDLFKKTSPKLAHELLYNRAVDLYIDKHFKSIVANPPQELLKARDIYQAIQDKSSVWITFGKESETLRLSIPTSAFYDSWERCQGELKEYALPDKTQKQLTDLFTPGDRWGYTPKLDDIVTIDYKGKVIYQDEAFYNQFCEPQKTPLAEQIASATSRASTQQNQEIQSKFVDKAKETR